MARSEMPAGEAGSAKQGNDVAMLTLESDVALAEDGDTAMLIDDSNGVERNSSWLHLKLKDIPWRIKKKQLLATAILVLILVGAIISSATYERRAVCYPLPAVANASATCRGKASLIAGHSCSVTCLPGWLPSSVFECGSDGQLVTMAVCLLNTSAEVLPS